MTIYQWVFFNCEDYFFNAFQSTSKDEADRQAWEYFKEALDDGMAEDIIDTTTAETFEEFIADDRHYINFNTYGSIECEYNEITVEDKPSNEPCDLGFTRSELSTLYQALGIADDWITEGLNVGGYDEDTEEEEHERLSKINDLYCKVEKLLLSM